MKKSENRVTFASRGAAFDVWVGMIGAIVASESSGDEELYLQGTGGRYILTGCDCLRQTGHSDFEVREARSPWFFVLIYGYEAIGLLVWHMSYIFRTIRCLIRRIMSSCYA